MAETQAFVTLATTDVYCMGSLVVGKSLRRHGTSRKLVVMVSPNLSRDARLSLEDVFDEVVMVDVLDSKDRAHLSWLGRPELGVTFTKLHCWTLTQYSKCVFLDADTLVLCNVDELFMYEELSAAPDPGWPDCFNSGVFVFRPSLNTHAQLLEHATQHGSFDGGDQGVLNTFFSDWAIKDIQKHLPFVYNLTASAIYTYLPAYHQYGHQAKIVHFLGGTKPWHFSFNAQSANESSLRDSNKNFEQFIHLWWVEFYSQRQLQVKKDDKNEESSFIHHSEEQLDPPETFHTPSQRQKSSTELHHRETSPSQPPLDQTISSPHRETSPSQPPLDLTISSPHRETSPSQPPLDLTISSPYRETSHSQPPLDLTISSPHRETSPSQPALDLIISSPHRETSPSQPPLNLTVDTLTISPSQKPEDVADEISLVNPLSAQESENTGLEAAEGSITTTAEAEPDMPAETEEENLNHRRMWEEGHIDYMGRDAFDNIKRKLDRFLD